MLPPVALFSKLTVGTSESIGMSSTYPSRNTIMSRKQRRKFGGSSGFPLSKGLVYRIGSADHYLGLCAGHFAIIMLVYNKVLRIKERVSRGDVDSEKNDGVREGLGRRTRGDGRGRADDFHCPNPVWATHCPKTIYHLGDYSQL